MTAPSRARRLGVTVPRAGMEMADLPAFVRTAEDHGYESVWSEEATGTDGFVPLAVAAASSSRLRLVTGVVNPYTRGWAVLAQSAATLSLISGGRFTLGLGSSSKVIVEQHNWRELTAPTATMRRCVDYLDRALRGERVDGGFRLQQPPTCPVPIVLAALRGKSLELAAEVAAGAFGNFLPVSAAATVRARFPADKEYACRVFSFGGDETEAFDSACRLFTAYGSSPYYRDFYAELGYGDLVGPMSAAWMEGDRRRALELVPKELVREIFLLGPPEAQRERLEDLWAAGIDLPVVALYGGSPEGTWRDLKELSASL